MTTTNENYFIDAPAGTTCLICVDDHYARETCAFRDMDDFLEMVAECFPNHFIPEDREPELLKATKLADGTWQHGKYVYQIHDAASVSLVR